MPDQIDEILMSVEPTAEEAAADETSTSELGLDVAADGLMAAVAAGDKAAFKAALKDAIEAVLMNRENEGLGEDAGAMATDVI